MPHSSGPARLIGTRQVVFGAAGRAGTPSGPAAEDQQAVPGPFHALWRRWWGWEDGGMPDAVPLVDLASLAAAGNHPGALWRLDGEDLQANLVRLDRGDRIQPHRNDEVDVLVVVVLGRGRTDS